MEPDEDGYLEARNISIGAVIDRGGDWKVEVERIEETDDGHIRLHIKQEGQTGNALLSIECYPYTLLKIAQ